MSLPIGKILIGLGIVLVILGLVFLFKEKLSILKLLGHLPGDFHYKKDGFQFYFPLTTSLIVSFILSLLFFFFRYR